MHTSKVLDKCAMFLDPSHKVRKSPLPSVAVDRDGAGAIGCRPDLRG